MAAAFAWTIGIVRSILGFDRFRFISNPPVDDSGQGWAALLVKIR